MKGSFVLIGEKENQRLDSWKEVAAYLGRNVRTVIRWEKEKGLPVHRVPGGRRKAVFAYTEELREWLTHDEQISANTRDGGLKDKSRIASRAVMTPAVDTSLGAIAISLTNVAKATEVPASGRTLGKPLHRGILGYVGAVGTVLILIIAANRLFVKVTRPSSTPVRLGFTLNAVQSFDSHDHLLWTHTFDGALEPGVLGKEGMSDAARIGDFRGDGTTEVLVAVPMRTNFATPDAFRLEVDLFSGDGSMLWSYVPDRKFQFGNYQIGAPWAFGDILVSSRTRKPVIWAAFINSVWGNSYVVNLDPETGKGILRFVNTGTLRALNEVSQQNKDFLLVGGFNNDPDSGSLAIIDESHPFAASPQTKNSRHECRDCPPGRPDYYFVFPRSEINEIDGLHENAVTRIQGSGAQRELIKTETQGPGDQARVYYLLDVADRFRISTVRFNSGYDAIHRKYEREGKLQHSLLNCPERLHPRPVRMWTPSTGWLEIQLPPIAFNQ